MIGTFFRMDLITQLVTAICWYFRWTFRHRHHCYNHSHHHHHIHVYHHNHPLWCSQAIGQVVPEADNSPVWASAHLLWGNQWGTKNHCCWWVLNFLPAIMVTNHYCDDDDGMDEITKHHSSSMICCWKRCTVFEPSAYGLTSSFQRILWRLRGAKKLKSCWQPWRRRWRWQRAWRRPKPSWTQCAARSWGSSRSRQTCIASLFSQWPSAWGRYGVTNSSD